MIRPCSCTNKYQDGKYGIGNRVKNTMPVSSGSPKKVRCTVCSNTETVSEKVASK